MLSTGYGVVMSSLVWPLVHRRPLANRQTCFSRPNDDRLPISERRVLSEAGWMSSPMPEAPLFFPGRHRCVARLPLAGSFCRDRSRFDTLALSVPCSFPAAKVSTSVHGAPGISAEPLIRRQPHDLRSACGGPYFCRAPESVASPLFSFPAGAEATPYRDTPGLSGGRPERVTRRAFASFSFPASLHSTSEGYPPGLSGGFQCSAVTRARFVLPVSHPAMIFASPDPISPGTFLGATVPATPEAIPPLFLTRPPLLRHP